MQNNPFPKPNYARNLQAGILHNVKKNTIPTAAVTAMTYIGSDQPPELSAKLPQILPETDTPTYENKDMKPIAVPVSNFEERFVAETPVRACGPYSMNPAATSAAEASMGEPTV